MITQIYPPPFIPIYYHIFKQILISMSLFTPITKIKNYPQSANISKTKCYKDIYQEELQFVE